MKKIILYVVTLNLILIQSGFAIGSISGIIYYRGPKNGNIYIGAYDHEPPFQGSPEYWTMINDTGPYTLSGVEDGAYWLGAYMDADSNHIFDDTLDPWGWNYDSCVVQGDSVIGIDILLDYYGSLGPNSPHTFYPIKLSQSIQSAWPGTEDYLCRFQVYADHPWGNTYIDSIWTPSSNIEGWGGRMYDDGLHLDEISGDSIFCHYEVKDSSIMHIWADEVLYWGISARVVYTPWLWGMTIFLTMYPNSAPFPIPELIEPEYGDTVSILQPNFSWHSNGAEWYEVIVWDTMPMPDNLGENIIWSAKTSIDDTTVAMSGTQLEHGKSYYWALVSYAGMDTITWKLPASAMEWALFIVDTTYIGIKENNLVENQSIQLFQNYPNPFSYTTTIAYSVGRNASSVELKIYDVSGRLVKQFDNQTIRLSDKISWDGCDDYGKKLSSGVYFYKLETLQSNKIKKMIILR
jgi:hypothetical protein